jgi:hypothetical protein
MATKSSKADNAAMTLAELGADIQRRRQAYVEKTGSEPYLPRNDGTRRTPSKRALLRAIKDAGGEW